ncbi:YoaK family protein [Kushneria sp. Sum13]|uniref:YoaK family protein n=1 Tax=Kushneria sp. Sum13 TaxID=3459196 RepID=UPI0040454264
MLDRKIPFPAFALLFMVAGATDALIYLHSRDLLAVYMTGNSSHIGRHIGEGNWAGITPLAAVIAAFFTATALGAWIGMRAGRWRPTVILLLTALLMSASMPFAQGDDYPFITVLLIAAAMGMLNQVSGNESGVTFLTGMLVRTGRAFAEGNFRAGLDGLVRWSALVTGAALAIPLNHHLGRHALLAIAAMLALGAVFTTWNALVGRHRARHPT